MNTDHTTPVPIDPIEPSEPAGQPVYAEDLPAPAPNPLLMVHRLMRGRYLLAIILAALLAPIGAIAGYMAMPGKFVSVAQIKVPATLDPILYPILETQAMGAAGYERAVGNEVEEMRRPERLRQAAALLNEYVNLYNQGLAMPLPSHAPEGRDWRIDEAMATANQLVRIAADEANFRALEEDWNLRSAAGADRRPAAMLEAVAPSRLLTPVGLPMPDREEIARTTRSNELLIDPRTSRRIIGDFADVFMNPTRPPRGQEAPVVWDAGPGAVDRLSAMLSIAPLRRSEFISVIAETDDPRLATLAANAVMVTHRNSSRYADVGKRHRNLQAREAELDALLRTTRRDVRAVRLGYKVRLDSSAPTGSAPRTPGPERSYAEDPRYSDRLEDRTMREIRPGVPSAALQRIRAVPVDQLLTEGYAVADSINAEIRLLDQQIGELELATALSTGTDDEALEKADPKLRALREEQRTLQLRLDRAMEDYGPNNRILRDIQAALTIATTKVQDRMAELRLQIETAREGSGEAGAMSTEALTAQLNELRVRRDEKRRDLALVNEWTRIMPDVLLDLLELETDSSRTARLLEEVRRERERLDVELVNLEQGRFQYSAALVPQRPSSDKRVALAAAGFMGGGGFAFVLIAAAGFLDRRYRYIEEIESDHKLPPVIGVLPLLTEKAGDSEQSEVASLTVHHVRNILLLNGRSQPGRARAITITSAGPGDGKTSVVVALGMSFAQAGYRTLVIDADLVGRGLSAHFGVRHTRGLSEALLARHRSPVDIQPAETGTPGLSVLSSGDTESFRPEHMARERFFEVVDHCRAGYDIVLIDSGPLLGSLEAGLATRAADRILLVVARGSEQRAVSAVVKRLRDSGLRHVSLIFNKAKPDDIEQSVSYISMRSQSVRAADQGGSGRRTGALARSLQPAAEPEEATR